MALIKCKECNKDISDKATVCVHCGCPIKNETKYYCDECGKVITKKTKYALIVVAQLILIKTIEPKIITT